MGGAGAAVVLLAGAHAIGRSSWCWCRLPIVHRAADLPGGGGKSLQDCMGFWDRATHMTKAEWKATCLRTMQEYPSVLR